MPILSVQESFSWGTDSAVTNFFPPIGGAWTMAAAAGHTPTVKAGNVGVGRPGGVGGTAITYSDRGPNRPSNYTVQASMKLGGTAGNAIGLVARVTPGTPSGYIAYFELSGSAHFMSIRTISGATLTTLDIPTSVDVDGVAKTVTARLTVAGSQITASAAGFSSSVTDASFPSGDAGIYTGGAAGINPGTWLIRDFDVQDATNPHRMIV